MAEPLVPVVAIVATLVFFGGWAVFIVWLIRHSKKTAAHATATYAQFHTELAALGAVLGDPDENGERWTLWLGERRLEARRLTAPKAPPVYSLVAIVEPHPDLASRAAGGPFRAPVASTPRLPPLVLRRETSRDRLGKALRINREWQLDDPSFDDHVYIETAARDDEVAHVLKAPGVRESVQHLLARGASRVAFADALGPVVAQWVGSREGFGPGGVAGAARELAALAQAVPAVASVEPARGLGKGSRWIVANAAVLGLGIATLIVGHVLFPTFDYALEGVSVLFGLAMTLLMTVTALIAVRGTATALRSWGWSVLLALIGFPLLAMGTARTINGALSSPPKTKVVEVLDRHVSRGSKSSSYYVTLAPFGSFDVPVTLSVSLSEYQRMVPRERIRIRVGAGALGHPWFDGIDDT